MRVCRDAGPSWTVGSAMRYQSNFPRLSGRIAVAALLAVSLTAGAPAPVQAEGRAEPMRVMLTVPKGAAARIAASKVSAAKVSGTRAGGFDWLAKRRPAEAQVQLASAGRALPRQIGRGSWICSPAGFGQKSRCHAN